MVKVKCDKCKKILIGKDELTSHVSLCKEKHARSRDLVDRRADPKEARKVLANMPEISNESSVNLATVEKDRRPMNEVDESSTKIKLACDDLIVRPRDPRPGTALLQECKKDDKVDMGGGTTGKNCGQKFQAIAQSIVHRTLLTGERHYICPTCNKSFLRQSSLTCHKRTHASKKPNVCGWC